MIRELVDYFRNKKVLILGFGLEGQSTYKFIREYLKEQKVYIADKEKGFERKYEFLKEDKNAIYISGERYLENLDQYDIIMKGPGISFVQIDTSSFRSKIKSQLELLLEFFDVYTIGITGSKGKSTTSTLIYEVIKNQGMDCMLLGNIGNPVFEYIDKIKEKMILVLEMSSHQLEYMEQSTDIAILLNVYEEHLDHYKSLENYAEAKCNIFKFQDKRGKFLHSIDSEILNGQLKKYDIKGEEYLISTEDGTQEDKKTILKDNKVYLGSKELYNSLDKRNLIGKYNLSNIMFALTVSEILELDLPRTIETINSFEPLPHRIERVGIYNDILFYNDAIATIPEATINSIEALEKVDTLIIGGMDRGVSFDKFIDYLNNSNIGNLICMPTTGHKIANRINNPNMKVYIIETLDEAVKTAKEVTKKNMICLLSPAAASYGFFKNFKEKGEIYKRIVRGEGYL